MRSNARIRNGDLYVHGIPVSWSKDVDFFKTRVLPNPAGRILMLGLGLGNDVIWCLEHQIQRLVVVELVPDVIALFRSRHPDKVEDPRLEIVCGSFPLCIDLDGADFDTIIYSIDDYKTLN